MKKNRSSKSWIIKQHRDPFYKKSKILGYRSRSAFKLLELHNKFRFIMKNSKLLDIGSSPGGWSQVASSIIKNGKIVAIDKKPMEKINNVIFFKDDFLEEKLKDKIRKLFQGKIDVIISDMAADTTGSKNLDCIRTNLLCTEVIDFSTKILKEKGVLVSKLFMGEEFLEVKKLAKKKFNKIEFYKPKASRSESKEIYMYCSGLTVL